jgi:chromosome segregation ATPase
MIPPKVTCLHSLAQKADAYAKGDLCALCLLGHREEADRHIVTIAQLRTEIDQLKANWRPERNSLVEERLLNEARAEIDQLKIDVEHWKTEDASGTELVLQLSAEVDQLCAERTDLQEQIATCRELRQYDRKEIERMRHLLSGAKP